MYPISCGGFGLDFALKEETEEWGKVAVIHTKNMLSID